MKRDNHYVLTFVNEVIAYFENMPMLTDDEEALLESARWTKDKLTNNKED